MDSIHENINTLWQGRQSLTDEEIGQIVDVLQRAAE
jgi:hypothetical protein